MKNTIPPIMEQAMDWLERHDYCWSDDEFLYYEVEETIRQDVAEGRIDVTDVPGMGVFSKEVIDLIRKDAVNFIVSYVEYLQFEVLAGLEDYCGGDDW